MLRQRDRCLPLNTRTMAVEQQILTRATPVPEIISDRQMIISDIVKEVVESILAYVYYSIFLKPWLFVHKFSVILRTFCFHTTVYFFDP